MMKNVSCRPTFNSATVIEAELLGVGDEEGGRVGCKVVVDGLDVGVAIGREEGVVVGDGEGIEFWANVAEIVDPA